MSSDIKRILIGTPCWGVAPPQCCTYREDVRAYCAARETEGRIKRSLQDSGAKGKIEDLIASLRDYPYTFAGFTVADQLVTFSREEICRTAVEGGYDYIAMIDDDMLGEVDLWDKLLALDVDVAAPIMFMRKEPHYPVVYAVKGGVDPGGNVRNYGTQVIRNYPKNTLFECDAVGFGAVLIKVDVLRKMPQPWFFVTNADIKGNTGEDIYFCVQARKAGVRVFCDSRIHLKHLGPQEFVGEEDYERCSPEGLALREATGEWSKEKQSHNLIA